MCYFTSFQYGIITTMIKFSHRTLKTGIYFPYILFSFEHNQSKFRKRSVSTRKAHSFALIRSNVSSRFLKFELIYLPTINKQVHILMSLVDTDVLRDVILNVGE